LATPKGFPLQSLARPGEGQDIKQALSPQELKEYFDYTRRRIKRIEEKALRSLAVKALHESLGREPSEDEIAEEIPRQRLIVEEQRLQWRQGGTEPFDIDAEIEEAQKIFEDINAKKTAGDLPDD
jgi:DNA-directed RNA polymerase specialized sigma subunit